MTGKKKILIIRFSSIGDIILTSPVVRILKSQLEEVELHYLTSSSYEPILEANPYIAKIHCFKAKVSSIIPALKKEKFDVIVDLHHNFRSLTVKKALGNKSLSVDKLNMQKWLMVNFKINLLPNRHIVQRYADTVKTLGVTLDDAGLDYFIPHKDEIEDDWLPESHRNELVVFGVGAKYGTKQLPRERMVEICDRINKPVILLGDKYDQETGAYIQNFFEKKNKNEPYEKGLKDLNKKTIIFDGCGKFNINQSASIIKRSIAVFSHDSALMHIAAAFGKQVFSIWGNTIPEFGMYPYQTKFTVFENTSLKCRPCSKIGHQKCPLGHFNCMQSLNFDFYIP